MLDEQDFKWQNSLGSFVKTRSTAWSFDRWTPPTQVASPPLRYFSCLSWFLPPRLASFVALATSHPCGTPDPISRYARFPIGFVRRNRVGPPHPYDRCRPPTLAVPSVVAPIRRNLWLRSGPFPGPSGMASPETPPSPRISPAARNRTPNCHRASGARSPYYGYGPFWQLLGFSHGFLTFSYDYDQTSGGREPRTRDLIMVVTTAFQLPSDGAGTWFSRL